MCIDIRYNFIYILSTSIHSNFSNLCVVKIVNPVLLGKRNNKIGTIQTVTVLCNDKRRLGQCKRWSPKVGERFVSRPAGRRLGRHKLEFVSAP